MSEARERRLADFAAAISAARTASTLLRTAIAPIDENVLQIEGPQIDEISHRLDDVAERLYHRMRLERYSS